MSTNYLALRNSNLSTFSAVNFTYSSLTGSTITARTATYSTITLASSIVSLGQSTNQTYYGQTNGVYTTGWGSTLNTLTSNVKQVAMGSLGQYQVAVCGASTANSVYVTQNSGQTWSTLSAATGLPTAATTLYTSGAISATGQYGILATTGGYPYITSSFGATYANVNPNVPAIYLPFETVPANSSVSQGTSPATLTVVGGPTLIKGIVGANALNFTNTAGSPPTQYIRGTWTPSTDFTISFWFNAQNLNGSQQTLFAACDGSFNIFSFNNSFCIYIGNAYLFNQVYSLTANMWYNMTFIYKASGVSSLYINNILIKSSTGPASPGTSSGHFTIGAGDSASPNSAFNGYIDDFKIYNSAIPFTPMVPMNYNYTAVSGNGQYMLASATNGGLFMSSNFGSTWSQVTSVANQGVWTGLCLSHTGQYMLTNGGGGYVVPNLTGLTGSSATNNPPVTWSANGITWVASASSASSGGGWNVHKAFNTVSGDGWLSIYNAYTNGATNGTTATMTISGIGSVTGEWLQLQSSIPLIMQSYAFSKGVDPDLISAVKTYYIVGSNDGSTWYPLQNCTTTISTYTGTSSYILLNNTSTQTTSGGQVGSYATTAYSYAPNPYLYFRIVITSLYPGMVYAEIGEWLINFIGGQSYSTNYGNSWVNTTFATGNALAISENGQYAIGANVQTAYIVNNYLAGFSTQSFTSPTLTSINATIVAAAISNTGQYMVLVTAGTSNNLYYSVNYGATFLSITLGSAPLVSCSMSYDGSYITAASATTIYTLNSNGTGFSLAVGSSAGAANQAQNAIALGNSAGQTNQTANSIILNASGSALNSYSQGFYVAPIATALSCTSQSVSLLGYGTDNQVVQSGITMANSQQIIYGEWVQLQLATAASITSYVLQPRGSFNISSGNGNRSPVSWIIVGSLDGINWIVLDTQINSTAYSGTYTLKSASPIYSYFRMIVTQISSTAMCDIGGFILYNNGNPIFTAPTTTSAIAPYTLSGTYNNILLLNSVMVCVVTWSWPTAVNTMGIYNDSTSTFFYPGIIAIVNGYINTANGASGTIFLGFIATVGPSFEYNSSYIATQGTSTIITNPLLQVADLSGNIKFQSSAQYPLDVNGVLRTQELQFQDGSIQGTASNMQLNWDKFGQNWVQNASAPSGNWEKVVCSYNGQYQMAIGTYTFVSSNYGQTWTSTGIGNGYLAISSSGQYQAISYLTNIYISSTYGQTFTTIAVPFSSAAIAMSGSGQYMIASYGKLIYTSSTYGQTWTYITSLSTVNSNIAMSSSGQYQTVAGDAGNSGYIYTSSNYGQTWTQYSALNLQFWYLSMSSSGQYQLVANFNGGNPSTTVYTSSNYGVSWNPVTIPNAFIAATAISGSGKYQIVAGGYSGTLFVGTLFVSTNYGATFSTTNYGNGSSYYHAVAISGSGQYATVAVYGGLVYTSVVPSYILGNVGIGTSAPAYALSVGPYTGILNGATFTLGGSSSAATGFVIPLGGTYLVTTSCIFPGSNLTWYNTSIVSYFFTAYAGWVSTPISSNNATITVSTTGAVTVSTPGGSGSYTWTINAIRLC